MRKSLDINNNSLNRLRKTTVQARIVNCRQIPHDFFGCLHGNKSEKRINFVKE